jgi:hypothetical protein
MQSGQGHPGVVLSPPPNIPMRRHGHHGLLVRRAPIAQEEVLKDMAQLTGIVQASYWKKEKNPWPGAGK